MRQHDGQQHAGVFHRHQAVRHTAAQEEQLPGLQALHALGRFEVEHAFEALHGDLARHLVQRHGAAQGQPQPDDLQLLGLEQGNGLRAQGIAP
eukprot:gene11262-23565_t